MSKTIVAAKSNSKAKSQARSTPSSTGAVAATLALALVVALEAGGVYAFSQGPSQPAVVASVDGVVAAPAGAPALKRAASVEISIVAQADTPAH